jgi:hypothetical protein
LAAMLFPALSAARARAQVAACASNLRQLVDICHVYAIENNGYVPIGRASDFDWVNYWFVDNTDTPLPGFYMFGSLYGAGLMPDGRVAYCPSQTELGFGYDDLEPSAADNNPWPPVVYPPGTSQVRGKAGYSMRPDYFVSFNNASTSDPLHLPRITDLANLTILCDLITHNTSVMSAHGTGLNRAMMDGSVAWVPISAVDNSTPPVSIAKWVDQLNPSNSTTQKNAAVNGIFAALDRY